MNKLGSIIANARYKTNIESKKTLIALMLLFTISSRTDKKKINVNDYEWKITKIEEIIKSNQKFIQHIMQTIENNKNKIQNDMELQIITEKEYIRSINEIKSNYTDLLYISKEITESNLIKKDKEYLLKKISIYMQ